MKFSLLISDTTMKLTSYKNSLKLKGMKLLLSPIYEIHEVMKNNMPKKFLEYIRK
jgi:hypothetical protein